jgi:hypothetical protein
MAIYTDPPEVLFPNVGDPLLGDLDTLELRSAFALDHDPGRRVALPGEARSARVGSSRDVVTLVDSVEPPQPAYLLVVLNAKNEPLHVMNHELLDETSGTPLFQVDEAAGEAVATMLEMAILGGGVGMIVVRFAPLRAERARGRTAAPSDVMFDVLLREHNDQLLPLRFLDYLWLDPAEPFRVTSARDLGLFDPDRG